jgi:hypothetical protein
MSWNDNTVAWLQLLLAAAGLAVLAWDWVLARKGEPQAFQRERDALLAVLGVLGFIAWFNFGHMHYRNYVHGWDTYHYYIGAKYFGELKYDLLYECTVVAEAEDLGRDKVQGRLVTDLRNNTRILGIDILARPQTCKDRFTPERWQEFRGDIEAFRDRVGRKWEQVLKDHGYNATPVWTMLGHALADTGPATPAKLIALTSLDPLFIAGTFAMIAWAFGWRIAMVAMLFFGTNIPSRFLWTGGAFLRHDWLFWCVGSICLLKKDKPFAAGAFIAYATLLRLFPGVAIAGPVCALIATWRREKRLEPRLLRYFAGGIAATAVLVAASLPFAGGPQSWVDFARNTAKHAATPLSNHMGLPTLVAFRPSQTVQDLRRPEMPDPWIAWKRARIESFNAAKPVYIALVIAALTLLYAAVARSGAEPWLAAALGMGMIAVGAELTCYYYSFMVGVLLAVGKRREVGIAMLAMSICWLLVDRFSAWDDRKYAAMTAVALAGYVGILSLFVVARTRGDAWIRTP